MRRVCAFQIFRVQNMTTLLYISTSAREIYLFTCTLYLSDLVWHCGVAHSLAGRNRCPPSGRPLGRGGMGRWRLAVQSVWKWSNRNATGRVHAEKKGNLEPLSQARRREQQPVLRAVPVPCSVTSHPRTHARICGPWRGPCCGLPGALSVRQAPDLSASVRLAVPQSKN